MMTQKDLDFVKGIAKHCSHNNQLAKELGKTLALGRAWLKLPSEFKKIPLSEVRSALAMAQAWQKDPKLRNENSEDLEKAHANMERWNKSPLLKKSSPQRVAQAIEDIDAWNKRSPVRGASPQDLLHVFDAIKGYSAQQLGNAATLKSIQGRSAKLRSLSPQQLDRVVSLLAFWRKSNQSFHHGDPKDLVESEMLVKEWKRIFGNHRIDEIIQAEILVNAWQKSGTSRKASPMELHQALELANAWSKQAPLKTSKPKDVAAALKWIAELANAPKASLLFNGHTLYWRQNGHMTAWPAVSGTEEYWKNRNFSVEAQEVRNYGPLPAGTYFVRQKDFQIRDTSLLELGKQIIAETILGREKGGSWSGNYESWGDSRVWIFSDTLEHDSKEIRARSGLAIHGGSTPGSNGCIDLVENMSKFVDRFRLYGRDMMLTVRY